MILIKAKDYYENDKERLKTQARDKYLKKKKVKRRNMEQTGIIICLKKRNKNYKNIKKNTVRLKNLNLINKVVFQLLFDSVCCELVIHH